MLESCKDQSTWEWLTHICGDVVVEGHSVWEMLQMTDTSEHQLTYL